MPSGEFFKIFSEYFQPGLTQPTIAYQSLDLLKVNKCSKVRTAFHYSAGQGECSKARPYKFGCSTVTFVAMATPKKVHFESFHEEKKPYKCDICDKSFSLKSILQTHIGSVHKKKNPFKCEICDYRCSQKGDLKKHRNSIH